MFVIHVSRVFLIYAKDIWVVIEYPHDEKGDALQQYKKYHIDQNDERWGLFSILIETYKIQKALYPGSFVHITPSFVIPSVAYIDTDRRAKRLRIRTYMTICLDKADGEVGKDLARAVSIWLGGRV